VVREKRERRYGWERSSLFLICLDWLWLVHYPRTSFLKTVHSWIPHPTTGCHRPCDPLAGGVREGNGCQLPFKPYCILIVCSVTKILLHVHSSQGVLQQPRPWPPKHVLSRLMHSEHSHLIKLKAWTSDDHCFVPVWWSALTVFQNEYLEAEGCIPVEWGSCSPYSATYHRCVEDRTLSLGMDFVLWLHQFYDFTSQPPRSAPQQLPLSVTAIEQRGLSMPVMQQQPMPFSPDHKTNTEMIGWVWARGGAIGQAHCNGWNGRESNMFSHVWYHSINSISASTMSLSSYSSRQPPLVWA
jgi:hypothetical protein